MLLLLRSMTRRSTRWGGHGRWFRSSCANARLSATASLSGGALAGDQSHHAPDPHQFMVPNTKLNSNFVTSCRPELQSLDPFISLDEFECTYAWWSSKLESSVALTSCSSILIYLFNQLIKDAQWTTHGKITAVNTIHLFLLEPNIVRRRKRCDVAKNHVHKKLSYFLFILNICTTYKVE